MTGNRDWKERGDKVFIGTYSRFPAAMVRGEGCRLWDADGREYIDFLSGIAVCSLGHCHPAVTEAVCAQAGTLVHVSNLFYTVPQIELAEMLTANSFADKVFMANSGAEANEAAIKLARIHSGPDRYEIISLSGSFHGRTLATVAATGQPKFHRGFDPLPLGFVHAEFGDPASLEKLIGEHTCAVLCEPLQGESGVRPLEPEYLQAIRKLCDKHDLLLIFDEVQTGMGRTGTLFAYQQLGVVPDIMTVAKALGNGLPIGAMLTREEIATSLGVGTHASTFGGNPVAAAAAVAVMRVMLEEGFLPGVRDRGKYLAEQLAEIAARFPDFATGVRGSGLLLGLVLTDKGISLGGRIVEELFQQGVLINFAGNRVLRFVPPLVVGRSDIDALIEKLALVLERLSS
ncbi:MAG TPA: acetylornithine transaminase [Desulfobacteraceae bacterium]|nr:acetylornithine transaminase [Desulfobacteraceae bacterium]